MGLGHSRIPQHGTLSNQAQAPNADFPHLYGLVLRCHWTVAPLVLLSEKTPPNRNRVGCIMI